MRILQVIETGGPGGAETVFAQLATGLVQRGHAVQCIIRTGSWLPSELERRGMVPVFMRGGGAFDVTLLRQLIGLIRGRGVDIVHAHLFDGAAYATLAAVLCGVPCLVTLHGQVDIHRRNVASWLKAALIRRGATATVTVSAALRDALQPVLRIPAGRIEVIHNGIEALSLADEPPVGSRTRTPNEPFRLVAVGNIRPAKDYPMLLRAMAVLRGRGVAVHLDVLGQADGHGLYEQLLALVTELGLTRCVAFHGFVSDPAPWLTRAQAFVLASSQEGFSLATIEAMLAGIPVVATRSGGPQEIVDHDVTGLLVPPQDPEALANAIARLAGNASLAQTLAQSAWQSARHRFSVGAMVDRYEALYRRMMPSATP